MTAASLRPASPDALSFRAPGAGTGLDAAAWSEPPLPRADRPLKVLITTDWWEPAVNGVVMSVTTLRRVLQEAGCDVRVLTLADGLRSSKADGIYRLGSLSASMFYDKARIGALRNDPIRREILEWGPDVIHSQCEFSTFVWAKRLSRVLDIPLVHTYHTIYEDYTHYYSPSRTMGRKMVAAFSRKLCDGTDAVIVPTQKVADLLHGYGVSTPISVVPTGLDLRRFRPVSSDDDRADVAALRDSLDIPADHAVLVSVCRLAKEKNVEEVVRSFAAAHRTDATLVLVGDGPSRGVLEALVDDLGIRGDVRFVGCVDPAEVPRYYRMGDVFVSASLSETQGLTFIEALACGIPLLCHRDPSLAGVVLDGITGWQFESTEEFAYRLGDMLDHPAERVRLAAAAAHHAHGTCSAEAFGERAMAVYRSVVRA